MPTQAKQQRPSDGRFEFEERLIEEAREEVRPGLRLDETEVEAWLAGLDGEVDLTLPALRKPDTPAS